MTDKKSLKTEKQIINYIKEYLRSNISNIKEYFEKISEEIEKNENREIRFDNTESDVEVQGKKGNRIVYGAFRYKDVARSDKKTYWTYTFRILENSNNLYLIVDKWAWPSNTNLSDRVDTHLE